MSVVPRWRNPGPASDKWSRKKWPDARSLPSTFYLGEGEVKGVPRGGTPFSFLLRGQVEKDDPSLLMAEATVTSFIRTRWENLNMVKILISLEFIKAKLSVESDLFFFPIRGKRSKIHGRKSLFWELQKHVRGSRTNSTQSPVLFSGQWELGSRRFSPRSSLPQLSKKN